MFSHPPIHLKPPTYLPNFSILPHTKQPKKTTKLRSTHKNTPAEVQKAKLIINKLKPKRQKKSIQTKQEKKKSVK